MKILCIAWHLTPTDGWGTLARNTVDGLRQRGHTVEVLVHETTAQCGAPQHRVLPSPLSLIDNPLSIVLANRAIRKAVRMYQPDIVHVLTEPYALALPRSLRARIVITVCGTYGLLPLHRWTRPLLLRAYRRAHRVLVISEYTRRRLLEGVHHFNAAIAQHVEQALSHITLGITVPTVQSARPARERKNILFVGGIKPRKGILELLKACKALETTLQRPFTLRLIGHCGQDPYAQSVRQFIEDHAMGDYVSIDGHVSQEELEQAYAEADLFVMLSKTIGLHFEGFGLVFLEANARGLPVIGPTNSGCVDAIKPGVSGYVADPDDSDAVCRCMMKVLDENRIDPAACIAWAQEHSVARQAEETERAYGAA